MLLVSNIRSERRTEELNTNVEGNGKVDNKEGGKASRQKKIGWRKRRERNDTYDAVLKYGCRSEVQYKEAER